MYYRRKIALALVQRFGGEMNSTRLHKLLLMLTRQQAKPAYDFVPYQYGAYSFQARADQSTMIKYGMLKDTVRIKSQVERKRSGALVRTWSVALNSNSGTIKIMKLKMSKVA
ncbi:MAG: hypothetical protein WD491_03810 [Balneolales bacterium]